MAHGTVQHAFFLVQDVLWASELAWLWLLRIVLVWFGWCGSGACLVSPVPELIWQSLHKLSLPQSPATVCRCNSLGAHGFKATLDVFGLGGLLLNACT